MDIDLEILLKMQILLLEMKNIMESVQLGDEEIDLKGF